MPINRKLQLHTETLRLLVAAELELVVGGRGNLFGAQGKGIVRADMPESMDLGGCRRSELVDCRRRQSQRICPKNAHPFR